MLENSRRFVSDFKSGKGILPSNEVESRKRLLQLLSHDSLNFLKLTLTTVFVRIFEDSFRDFSFFFLDSLSEGTIF